MADYQGSTTNPAFRDMTQTPRWLYEALNAEFNFCLDAAALPETALHTNYLTPEIDALKVSWGGYIPADVRNPFVWLNPPYSDIGPWIKKCLKEKECGIGSVVLIPEDSSAEWWPADQCSEIWRITGYYNEKGKWCSGRINFINAETGEEMKGNPKGSNLLIFIPGCKYHIGTKHVSKGELLAIGNLIITAEAVTYDDLLDCTEAEMQEAAA
jgi:phage N-6-adenine-methyltransferase